MPRTPDLTSEQYLALLIEEEKKRIQCSLDEDAGSADHLQALLGYLAATNVRLGIVEQLLARDEWRPADQPRLALRLSATALGSVENLMPLEKIGDEAVRWIGPGRTVTLSLSMPRWTQFELSIRVVDVIDAGVLSGLRIAVDGRETASIYRPYYGGNCLICPLRRRDGPATPTELRITLPFTRSFADAGRGDDQRQRGIAIGELCVNVPPDRLRRTLRYLHWQKVAGLLSR